MLSRLHPRLLRGLASKKSVINGSKQLRLASTLRKTSYGSYSKNRFSNGLTASAIATAAIGVSLYSYSIENGTVTDSSKKPIDPQDVAKHNNPKDCWVVIDGYVYDLTEFIHSHPGGPSIIENNAGKDVTAIFGPIHAPDVIEKYIAPEKRIGPLDGVMPQDLVCPPLTPGETPDDIVRKEELRSRLPSLDALVNLYDFEYLASQILTKQAWSYYSSAADDEVTYRENHAAYHRIFFKPKVLVDVREVDTSTKILGEEVPVPFYVSATALCKLGNPKEGEKDVARGCGQGPIKCPQMISTLASCSLQEIVEAAPSKEQIQWFQLYVNTDRKITDDLIKQVEKLGLKAIFVTVDAPSLGRREKDMKVKFTNSNGAKAMENTKVKESKGASAALSTFIDPALSWDDIVEIKKKTNLPIVIKGVQRVEDVLKAAEVGAAGVVLSNHGGRQLDFSRAPIEVLAESVPVLKERNLSDKLEIFIDGGVRRGNDVLKALCLGAKGVGLGRPFLYANSCYGKDGVQKAIEMLTEEIQMSMRLLGVTKIADLKPELLDMSSFSGRTVNVPQDSLYRSVYEKSETVQFLDE